MRAWSTRWQWWRCRQNASARPSTREAASRAQSSRSPHAAPPAASTPQRKRSIARSHARRPRVARGTGARDASATRHRKSPATHSARRHALATCGGVRDRRRVVRSSPRNRPPAAPAHDARAPSSRRGERAFAVRGLRWRWPHSNGPWRSRAPSSGAASAAAGRTATAGSAEAPRPCDVPPRPTGAWRAAARRCTMPSARAAPAFAPPMCGGARLPAARGPHELRVRQRTRTSATRRRTAAHSRHASTLDACCRVTHPSWRADAARRTADVTARGRAIGAHGSAAAGGGSLEEAGEPAADAPSCEAIEGGVRVRVRPSEGDRT